MKSKLIKANFLTAILSVFIPIPAIQAASDIKLETTKYEQPMIFDHEVGKTVMMKIKIDENGNPQSVTPINNDEYDKQLANRVAKAVCKWQFKPIHDDNNQAISYTIHLPIKIKDIQYH